MRLLIKPLSVNKAYRGKRYKSADYKQYIKDCQKLLTHCAVPDGDFSIVLEFGASTWRSDVDNVVKPFLDILQARYGFNDSRIEKLFITKTKVEKGQEFIWFEFKKDLQVLAI